QAHECVLLLCLFPYTTLFRSCYMADVTTPAEQVDKPEPRWQALLALVAIGGIYLALPPWFTIGPTWLQRQVNPTDGDQREAPAKDRKSTRLNSSHRTISYAVF